MRCLASLLLLLTIFVSCSKNNAKRTNFAELTVGGNKFVFDSVAAVFDTSAQAVSCDFTIFNRSNNSSVNWETLSGSKWINGIYEYPGELFPGRSVVYLNLQTYVDRVPGTYSLDKDNSVTVTIDQSENGRIHGTLSAKATCYTCSPYGAEVSVTNGEFEMPYSYR